MGAATESEVSPGLSRPGTPAYEAATHTYNLQVNLRPSLATTVRTVDEARTALAEARSRGLGVRVLTTGHSSDAAAPLSDEVVVRLAFEIPPVVDVTAHQATVWAGTRWRAVVEATSTHGLVALHGTSPTVGTIGYLLGGGISVYGRRYGIAANSIRSFAVMDADGRVSEVGPHSDAELFYALRGGGGGLGIVISVTIGLYPVTQVVTGAAFWPIEPVSELVRVWRQWAVDAPATASTSLRIMRLPDGIGLPAEVTGRPVLCVDGVVVDEPSLPAEEVAEDLLGPMRKICPPLLDGWHRGGPVDVTTTHMDPLDPLPYEADHMIVEELTDEGQQALLSVAATDAGSALSFVELRQLGGAIGQANDEGGAVSHLGGAYATYALGVVTGTANDSRIGEQLAALRSSLGPWDTGFTAPTFAAGWDSRQQSFSREVAERVARTRARVDPLGVFSGNVSRGAEQPG